MSETQVATKLTVEIDTHLNTPVKVTTDASAKQLLGLSGSHENLDRAILVFEHLLLRLKKKSFQLKEFDAANSSLAVQAIEHALRIDAPIIIPISIRDFYGAPTWMNKDSAVYAEYKHFIDTRWFAHTAATPLTDHLLHLFGLHATLGDVKYWSQGTEAHMFVAELVSIFRASFGEEPNAAALAALRTLEDTVRLAVNLAKQQNYGSLETILPLIELLELGIIPIGIRDDRNVLVAFK